MIIIGLICILSFSLYPFLIKKILHDIPFVDFYTCKMCALSLHVLIYLIYSKRNIYIKMIQNHTLLSYFIISQLCSIVAIYLFHILLEKYPVTVIIPYLQALHLMGVFLLGWFFFHENIDPYRILGIFCVIFGILKLNHK